jgi:NADH-quinone oxidoreductase subunit A
VKDFLPILLQVGIVLGFGISALLISVLLGKSAKRTPMKDSAYECGMLPQGEAQPRFSVKFYLVAMLFILFDLEVVFIVTWATVFRDLVKPEDLGGIGPAGLWAMVVFIFILEVGHFYAWKQGALTWAPLGRRAPRLASSTNGVALGGGRGGSPVAALGADVNASAVSAVGVSP